MEFSSANSRVRKTVIFTGFRLFLAFAAFAMPRGQAAPTADTLATEFANPPDSARPQTWFHWMNGNITKEGLTRDLEEIKRVGLGGVQVFNVKTQIPQGPVDFLSDAWRELFKHTATECERLGLELSMHNCDGYSESGGPWVTPEQSMQRVVSTEIQVTGPQQFSGILPQPPTVENFYRDIAVLAFPTPDGEQVSLARLAPKVTTSAAAPPDARSPGWFSLAPPTPEKPAYVQWEFARPFSCRALTMQMGWSTGDPKEGVLQVSDDGRSFRDVCPLSKDGISRVPITVAFPQVTARYYRILINSIPGKTLTLRADLLAAARPDRWELKAGNRAVPACNDWSSFGVPIEASVDPKKLVDLTSRLGSGSHLEWEVPSGNWTILRVGHTSTGKRNNAATDSGSGLEVDKMNPQAVESHFEAVWGKLIADVGPLAGKSFRVGHVDSWEAQSQNWTPAFRTEFLKRRGYELFPYLPAMAGRVVENMEVTERFLWDLRRTIGDLIAENHFGVLKSLLNRHGLKLHAEALGPNLPTIGDAMLSKIYTDVPMAEFWIGQGLRLDCKEAASSSHLHGKSLVPAEAFTALRGGWKEHPYSLKTLGDEAFCAGINRFVFHRYAHQPWPDGPVPGMTMGQYGINFERTNTWWNQSPVWLAYLARCQYLLQQGQFVGDVVYYYGEHVPNRLRGRDELKPVLPVGYDYDGCGRDELLSMSVRDGRVILPSGMSYRLLVLPELSEMSLEVAATIKKLVMDGATVVGPKPVRSPSLEHYPACDDALRTLAEEIWGDCDGKKISAHPLGQGRVIWGQPMEKILAAMKLPPDFAYTAAPDSEVLYLHRRTRDADIYFVSNQKDRFEQAECTFRVSGKAPELWDPNSGRLTKAAEYWQAHDRTTMPLRLDPYGSVFVVFRNQPASPTVVSFSRSGQDLLKPTLSGPSATVAIGADGGLELVAAESGNYTIQTADGRKNEMKVDVGPPLIIEGPWLLKFPPNWSAPAQVVLEKLISWTEHGDPGVKYFSGTATYERQIEVPAAMVGERKDICLDLGRIKYLAEVKVNGKNLGILWKPPFRVDITDAARQGSNRLEVRVTNLWPNRLIGDEQLPDDVQWFNASANGAALAGWPDWFARNTPRPSGRHTFTTWKFYNKNSPLLESGLLGPVRLVPVMRQQIP